MSGLELTTDATAYAPGERARITLVWNGLTVGDEIDLVLLWRTSGKGTMDEEIVWQQAVPIDAIDGRAQRDVVLPLQPHSYQGVLVGIDWHVEAEQRRAGVDAAARIVIAPAGRPCQGTAVEDPDAGGRRAGCLRFGA